ncbi:MAG: hypothetical protein ACR2QI_02500 [Woeseiaceae bacterium]
MVARPEAITETAANIALEMAEHMEILAAAGDWDDIENIAVRLRRAVMNVPDAERRAVVLAVQRSNEKVALEAGRAHRTVTEKISELRRGQAAKKAYELR